VLQGVRWFIAEVDSGVLQNLTVDLFEVLSSMCYCLHPTHHRWVRGAADTDCPIRNPYTKTTALMQHARVQMGQAQTTPQWQTMEKKRVEPGSAWNGVHGGIMEWPSQQREQPQCIDTVVV
jgi:hypothetical protein